MNISGLSGLSTLLSQQPVQEQKIPLEHKLNQLEVGSMMSQARFGGVDAQKTGQMLDNYMMSEEAQKQMNLISGTAENDVITSSLNQEDGSITININGEDHIYTAEQALKSKQNFTEYLADNTPALVTSTIANYQSKSGKEMTQSLQLV